MKVNHEVQAMSSEFSIGDVVALKSGGPKMTVTAADFVQFAGGKVFLVSCKWWSPSSKGYQHDNFNPETIHLVKDE